MLKKSLIVLAIFLGLLIGIVDLQVESPQIPALLLLLLGIFLGYAQPRNAWRSALIIGACIPIAQFTGLALHYESPYHPGFLRSFVTFVPAFAGAYLGVLLNRLLARWWPKTAEEQTQKAG